MDGIKFLAKYKILYNVWLLITILAATDVVPNHGQVTICDLITSLIKF